MPLNNSHNSILEEYVDRYGESPFVKTLIELPREHLTKALEDANISTVDDLHANREQFAFILEAREIEKERMPERVTTRHDLAMLLERADLSSIGIKLHANQSDAIKGLINFLRNTEEHSGYIVQPTGAGKTYLFGIIAKLLQLKTVILVPTITLVDQTEEELIESLKFPKEQIGRIVPGQPVPKGKQIIISTYASHVSRMKKKDDEGREYRDVAISSPLMICDEAHRSLGEKTRESLDEAVEIDEISEEEEQAQDEVFKHLETYSVGTSLKLGFTATPELAEKDVGAHFGRCIAEESVDNLIKAEVLVRPEWHQVRALANKGEITTNITTEKEGEIIDREDVYPRLLDEWQETNNDLKTESNLNPLRTVVYCANTNECGEFVKNAEERGLRCEVLTYKETKGLGRDDRKDYLKMLEEDLLDGKIDFIVTVNVLAEGWDCRPVNSIMLARATLSNARNAQSVGRGLRAQKDFEDERFGPKECCHVFETVWKMRKHQDATGAKQAMPKLTYIGRDGKMRNIDDGAETVVSATAAELFGKEYQKGYKGQKVEKRQIKIKKKHPTLEIGNNGVGVYEGLEYVYLPTYVKNFSGVTVKAFRQYLRRFNQALHPAYLGAGVKVKEGGKSRAGSNVFLKVTIDNLLKKSYREIAFQGSYADLESFHAHKKEVDDLLEQWFGKEKSKPKPIEEPEIESEDIGEKEGLGEDIAEEIQPKPILEIVQVPEKGEDVEPIQKPKSEKVEEKVQSRLISVAEKDGFTTEMTWEVNGIPFTLPVDTTKSINDAIDETIPSLISQHFGADLRVTKAFREVVTKEYVLGISLHARFQNDERIDDDTYRYLIGRIEKIFEERYLQTGS